ncbi:MAG: hypothetical protein JXO22_09910 [Phycisphaerae bacterium]|nr:hypothetical protein [Phycisphaerae bacterium]
MSEADNAHIGQEPLRVGLMADEESGPAVAAALLASPRWNLVATTGAQLNLGSEITWYDDRRVMITDSRPDALVLATSPRTAVELDGMFAAHELPVWRTPPLARDFAEGVQLIRQISAGPRVYRVASWWEHVREPVRQALHAVEDFKPRFTEVMIAGAGPSVQSWRAGLVDAGGGVLALDAYSALEALVAVRGLPDNVSAAIGKFRRHPGEAPRETEDVGTAILRYESGGIVLVRATWDLQPAEQYTRHHGPDSAVNLTSTTVSTHDYDGSTQNETHLPAEFIASELDHFADEVAATAPPEDQEKTLERHLAVNALLEAMYLSARTWQPESPRRFYEVQGWRLPR